jgi:hypothetical protein
MILNWALFAVCFALLIVIFGRNPKRELFISTILMSVTGTFLALFLSHLLFTLPVAVNIYTILIALYGAGIFILFDRILKKV